MKAKAVMLGDCGALGPDNDFMTVDDKAHRRSVYIMIRPSTICLYRRNGHRRNGIDDLSVNELSMSRLDVGRIEPKALPPKSFLPQQ